MYPPAPPPAERCDHVRVAGLLAQRPPGCDRARPDQLLWHVAPHASQLLAHAAAADITAAAAHVDADRSAAAESLVVRAAQIVQVATSCLRLLHHGGGPRQERSAALAMGLACPDTTAGWRAACQAAIGLETGLRLLLDRSGSDLGALYRRADPGDWCYRLAEAMTDLDIAASTWRHTHTAVAARLAHQDRRGLARDRNGPVWLFPSLALIDRSSR